MHEAEYIYQPELSWNSMSYGDCVLKKKSEPKVNGQESKYISCEIKYFRI